jgi:hypothetical protein
MGDLMKPLPETNRDTVFRAITIGLVTEKRWLSHEELVGRLSGSREPSPSVSALTGFDPGRKEGGNRGD